MNDESRFGGGMMRVVVNPDGSKQISAQLYGYVFQEEGMWISVCPTLDISTCGETQKQALDATVEALQLFFEACMAHGTLDQALRELHWVRCEEIDIDGLTKIPEQPKKRTTPAFHIDPIHLDVSKRRWTSQAVLAC